MTWAQPKCLLVILERQLDGGTDDPKQAAVPIQLMFLAEDLGFPIFSRYETSLIALTPRGVFSYPEAFGRLATQP